MSGLDTWEHRIAGFDSDDWVLVDVDLDLERAVTLVATASATVVGVDRDDGPPYRFEYGVSWILQDTLTGADWHRVAGGRLLSALPRTISRVSSPLGTSARLGVKPEVLGTMDYTGLNVQNADGWSHLWQDIDLVKPTDVRINVAVRSI
jgi:hypothetical protein